MIKVNTISTEASPSAQQALGVNNKKGKGQPQNLFSKLLATLGKKSHSSKKLGAQQGDNGTSPQQAVKTHFPSGSHPTRTLGDISKSKPSDHQVEKLSIAKHTTENPLLIGNIQETILTKENHKKVSSDEGELLNKPNLPSKKSASKTSNLFNTQAQTIKAAKAKNITTQLSDNKATDNLKQQLQLTSTPEVKRTKENPASFRFNAEASNQTRSLQNTIQSKTNIEAVKLETTTQNTVSQALLGSPSNQAGVSPNTIVAIDDENSETTILSKSKASVKGHQSNNTTNESSQPSIAKDNTFKSKDRAEHQVVSPTSAGIEHRKNTASNNTTNTFTTQAPLAKTSEASPNASSQDFSSSQQEINPIFMESHKQENKIRDSNFQAHLAYRSQRTFTPNDSMLEIVKSAKDGSTSLELQLEPAHLGKVHVQIQMDAGKQVQVSFTVDQNASRQALEQHIPQLKLALAQQGLDLGGFSMQMNQQQNQGNQSSSGSDSALIASELTSTTPTQDETTRIGVNIATDGRLSILA